MPQGTPPHRTRTLSEQDFAVPIDDRYFEDYTPDAVYEYGYITVSEADILDFARSFDPQPIHTDPEFAAQGPFGGLIASGWHTAGVMMRILVDHYLSHVASLASPGIDELRWPAPAIRCGCAPRSSRPGVHAPSQTAGWCGPKPS
jgi:acyl dehydratase